VDRVSLELVVVVEREDDTSLELAELVDQDREHLVHEINTRCAEQRKRPRTDPGHDRAQRLHDIRPKARGIAVGCIECHPRERSPGLLSRAPLR